MENICIVNELRKKLLAMLKVEDFKTDINLTQIGLPYFQILVYSMKEIRHIAVKRYIVL